MKTSAQRIDSVMIGANIKRMNRLSLFHKVFANVVCLSCTMTEQTPTGFLATMGS